MMKPTRPLLAAAAAHARQTSPFCPLAGARLAAALAACGLIAALSIAPMPASAADAAAPLLKTGEVTEDALIDALEIDSPDAEAASGATTRSLRPAARADAARRSKPAGPGKASLLITFATGSAELSADTKTALQTVAKALQSDRLAGFAFRVEGHADPRGNSDYNTKLSAERAAAVVAYLTGTLGVLPERLTPVGKGASELLNPKRADAPENRRVTIVTHR